MKNAIFRALESFVILAIFALMSAFSSVPLFGSIIQHNGMTLLIPNIVVFAINLVVTAFSGYRVYKAKDKRKKEEEKQQQERTEKQKSLSPFCGTYVLKNAENNNESLLFVKLDDNIELCAHHRDTNGKINKSYNVIFNENSKRLILYDNEYSTCIVNSIGENQNVKSDCVFCSTSNIKVTPCVLTKASNETQESPEKLNPKKIENIINEWKTENGIKLVGSTT